MIGSLVPQLYYLSLAVDIVVAAAFIGFGYLSGHGQVSAFVIGLALYVLDAFIYLGLMVLGRTPAGLVAIIWHGVAIYFLSKGLAAARELRRLPPEVPSGSPPSS
jgi:hypothetical protein